MKVTLLIPTLNELVGMKQIMPEIKREWVDQIIIVDGGSTDGTLEYATDNGYFVVRQKKRGMRHAYIEVLDIIEGDILITFSPDGNSLPGLIPPLIEKMKEGYDMVIVSRYAGTAKSYDDDMVTSFGNRMFTSLINLFHGAKYTDAMVMFRAYKTKLLRELDLDKEESYASVESIFHTVIGIEPLLSIRAAKRKLKVADIPGDEPVRVGSARKLQVFRWGGAYLAQVFREIFIWH